LLPEEILHREWVARSPCPYPVGLVNRETSMALSVGCGKRTCRGRLTGDPTACAVRWVKRTRALLLSGLKGHGEPMVYVVLTAPGVVGPGLAAWNQGAPAKLQAFIRGARRRMGCELEYFWTAELQKRGAIHYNLILRGTRYLPLTTWNSLAASAGFGTNGLHPRLIRPSKVLSAGSRSSLGGVTWYVTKLLAYVLKDAPGWAEHSRVYGHSHRWPLAPDPLTGRRGWVAEPEVTVLGADGRGWSGTRQELQAAGLLGPSSWRYVGTEVDAYTVAHRARLAAAGALWVSLGALAALKASETAPEGA